MTTFAIHGRNTKDTNILSSLLGRGAFLSGLHARSFLDKEVRSGFPSVSYVRIDKEPIPSKEIPETSDIIVVMDSTLDQKIYKKTNKESIIIMNTSKKANKNVKSIDASALSIEAGKGDVPVAVMFGAATKAFGKISLKNAKVAMEQENIKENYAAFEAGFKAIK
jgi:Pyruvate/2-oxoacid:ferredoxin oxidoreductase gamma subunit